MMGMQHFSPSLRNERCNGLHYRSCNINVSALNGVFGKLFSAERLWLKNLNFPFGVSIVVVAKKA